MEGWEQTLGLIESERWKRRAERGGGCWEKVETERREEVLMTTLSSLV